MSGAMYRPQYLIAGSASTPSCFGLGGAGRALGGRAILRLKTQHIVICCDHVVVTENTMHCNLLLPCCD